MRIRQHEPAILHFGKFPISLLVLQRLIWCTWYNGEHPFPVEVLALLTAISRLLPILRATKYSN